MMRKTNSPRRIGPAGVFCLIMLLANPAIANESTAHLAASCIATAAPEGVTFESVPTWRTVDGLPPHCEVRGLAAGKIRFVMRLPAEWKERFLLTGCGGFCGELRADRESPSNSINPSVRRGYAAISHDGGHQAASWETAWASDTEALEIWAHKVLPIMTRVGVVIAESVYGTTPRYKYFSGCSNGGRLGMMAAQRYPGLFDGIAAGASVFDLSGTAGVWGTWMTRHTLIDGKPVIVPERWALIHRKILERCDALDGEHDERIDAPRDCKIDFESFTRGEDPLTLAEVEALRALYGGVRDTSGDVIYPSLEFGAEFFGDIWLGGAPDRPAWGVLASQGYRQMLEIELGMTERDAGGNADTNADDAAAEVERVRAMIARSAVPALTDAADTDLQAHARSGSKMLLYHGLADPLIIPQPLERYYEQAAEQAGGLAALREHTRLFMIPGWGHCWERQATAGDDFDPLVAVEGWVERGEAPNSLPLRLRDGQRILQVPMR